MKDTVLPLKYLQLDFSLMLEGTSRSLSIAQQSASRLDAIEESLASLGHQVTRHSDAAVNSREKVRNRADISWDRLLEASGQMLVSRGVKVDALSFQDLLEESEIDVIQRRFSGGLRLQADLDHFDIAAMIAAGLTASLVDFLVVRIPSDMTFHGLSQEGSEVTKWIKSFDVPSNNKLAKYFVASFDKVKDIPIEGFSGWTHRLQTFAHDPLVGLVIGTLDVMRGGLTGVSKDGVVQTIDGTGTPISNPLVALFVVLGHLLSDVATKMGLPAPGFSLTHLLQIGNFGDKERSLAEVCRFMYLKGYDTRHFLTMTTPVAAAEIVLRAYVGLRRYLDPDYEEAYARQKAIGEFLRISAHPRFQLMSLGAHGIAAASNAGKIAIYGGNPLAFNYAQWMYFSKQLFKWLQMKMASPTSVVAGYVAFNECMLLEGWPKLDFSVDDECPDFALET